MIPDIGGYDETVNRIKRLLLKNALRMAGGNKYKAAQILRIKRPRLISLLRRYKTVEELKEEALSLVA